jgi:DNA (cytosine-5)-methyltransferase 1
VIYGSVCSGIEAASVAWHPLGWTAAFLSEIEPFPRAVLAHHYPEVPLHGDFTTIEAGEYEPIDLLVGGTPCQSFSVAGLRGGLEDERGNLALGFCRLVDRLRPRWVVWENVPGVLSSGGGRDFGAILGALGQLGYGCAYRILDAQYFGVPQRRRRVFVVGCLGDWRRAAAVLFERESLRGDSAPRRHTGQGVAPRTIGSLTGSGWGVQRVGESRGQDPVIVAPELARCVATREGSSQDWETTTMVAHSLRADGFDASEDGTGRGTPLIAFDTTQITSKANRSNPQPGDPCHTLAKGADAPAIAFHTANSNMRGPIARADGVFMGVEPHPSQSRHAVMTPAMAVRRLTPRECERLQGFPDDFTLVPYRGKPAADGPRYKALGNSMAVPVVRWIGQRIEMVEAIA